MNSHEAFAGYCRSSWCKPDNSVQCAARQHQKGLQGNDPENFGNSDRKEGIIRASYGCEGFLGNYEGEVRNTPFFCSAGISVGSVLIDGSISACSSIRSNYHQGNIYQDDFWEIWQTKFQPYRDRSWMKKDECARCKYFRYCQGNGMHLRDNEGKLLVCHLNRLTGNSANVPE